MMPVKHSPPPVQGLYQGASTEPILVMRGSSHNPGSNSLAFAWPHSDLPNGERGQTSRPGSGDRLRPLAEKRKDHASLVVSPSGQTLVKVQSSYQGYFTPDSFYTVHGLSPGTSPTSGITIKSTPRRKRDRVEDKIGSFFSLKKSPSDSPHSALVSLSSKHTSPGVSPVVLATGNAAPSQPFASSSQVFAPSIGERSVKFRGGPSPESPTSPTGSMNPSMESSGYGWSFEDRDVSGSSLYSTEQSPDWYQNGRTQGQRTGYKTDDGRSWDRPSSRWLCQRCLWWVATLLVLAILCINLSLFYHDYQASSIPRTAGESISLKTHLKRHLISQPIAVGEISSAFDSFLRPNNNRSTVVLSFHGGTGIGKSFTSDLIREYYFGSGDESSCVSTFSVPIYSAHEMETIREKVVEWLAVKDETCHPQIYILEDLHGYTPCRIVSMLHKTLKLFIERKDCSKRVIIVITNIAAFSIMQDALYNLETNAEGNLDPLKFRSAIQRSWSAMDDFDHDDDDSGQTSVAGFGNLEGECGFGGFSEIIDVTVPFLPLQRQDVKQCAVSIASRNGWTISREQEEWVADQLKYEPSHWPVFSSSGCKLVAEKLGLIHNLNVREI